MSAPASPEDLAAEAQGQLLAAEARGHLLVASSGALATLSQERGLAGYPFGSVVPYALDEAFRPHFLISRIAQHTKNLAADPRASLMVQDRDAPGDPQASWRITLVGDVTRLAATPGEGPGSEEVVGEEALAELTARYLARVPGASQYHQMHDFDYWRLEPRKVRFIGGFGKIRWVEPAALRASPHPAAWAEAAPGIVEHMNADHADALRDYCEGFRGFRPAAATLSKVGPTGFLVTTREPAEQVWFDFGREVPAAEARQAFVGLVGEARERMKASAE